MCSVAHVCPPARTTVSNFFPFLTSFHPLPKAGIALQVGRQDNCPATVAESGISRVPSEGLFHHPYGSIEDLGALLRSQ